VAACRPPIPPWVLCFLSFFLAQEKTSCTWHRKRLHAHGTGKDFLQGACPPPRPAPVPLLPPGCFKHYTSGEITPAALARPRALAATATTALPRARTARQTCRNRPTIATSTPQVLKSPQKPRGVTQSTCTCVMHALRAGRGARCTSVFVRRPSLMEMTAIFIYPLSECISVGYARETGAPLSPCLLFSAPTCNNIRDGCTPYPSPLALQNPRKVGTLGFSQP
jgi:hypothetical protein